MRWCCVCSLYLESEQTAPSSFFYYLPTKSAVLFHCFCTAEPWGVAAGCRETWAPGRAGHAPVPRNPRSGGLPPLCRLPRAGPPSLPPPRAPVTGSQRSPSESTLSLGPLHPSTAQRASSGGLRGPINHTGLVQFRGRTV